MRIFRQLVAQALALSIIAGPLLCGCVGVSAQAGTVSEPAILAKTSSKTIAQTIAQTIPQTIAQTIAQARADTRAETVQEAPTVMADPPPGMHAMPQMLADAPCHDDKQKDTADHAPQHDCPHCSTSVSTDIVPDALLAILPAERDAPDSAPLPTETLLGVARRPEISDADPPPPFNPSLSETLVSKHILLLI